MKYAGLKDKTLALFFTCGISLKIWHDMGMIDREVALYNELGKYFKHIYFFTYGRRDDLRFKNYLADNITVIPRNGTPNSLLHSLLLPFIHRQTLKQVDILKTNQIYGAWSAALTKLLYRNKLVVRTGYMWSVNSRKEDRKSWQSRVSRKVERWVYGKADAAITGSQGNYDYAERHYHPRNHTRIPSYIDTGLFKPLSKIHREKGAICFIGRMSHEKNLPALLEALKGLPYSIDIIGAGPQRSQLQETARHSAVRANFLGSIPNRELPEILNRHQLFVLPSLWEGMPKTLLEAMACGLPAIGTDVDGIKEVIRDGENGILCHTDAESIRQAIIRVMNDEKLRERLGASARQTIERDFSLEKLLEKELELYSRLLKA